MGRLDALREAKLELAYFILGIALMVLSPVSQQLAPLLFWGGALLAFLGWIAFGFKIKALIVSSRIELLKKMIDEEVKRSKEAT